MLETVADEYPEVLAYLARGTLSWMTELHPGPATSWAEIEGRAEIEKAAAAIREALTAWGKGWHLSDRWCIEAAASTVAMWASDGRSGSELERRLTEGGDSDQDREWRRELWTYPVGVGWESPRPEPPAFAMPTVVGWDPNGDETRAKAWKRAGRILRAAFYAEADRVARELDERGYGPAIGSPSAKQVGWLVDYQCGGMSYGELAVRDCGSPDTRSVRDGVREAARISGLTIRLGGRGGAPRKRPLRPAVGNRGSSKGPGT